MIFWQPLAALPIWATGPVSFQASLPAANADGFGWCSPGDVAAWRVIPLKTTALVLGEKVIKKNGKQKNMSWGKKIKWFSGFSMFPTKPIRCELNNWLVTGVSSPTYK